MKESHSKDNKMVIPLLRIDYSEEEINFIKDGVEEILKSGFLTMATKVKRFENLFASWVGSRYALGTNSGTSSIEIPLRAIDVAGKTIICPSNTYMATPIAVIHAGAKVAFSDCDKYLQMDIESLKKILDSVDAVAAVVIVHIGGIISPKFWEIKKLCDERGIPVIEDAAHAHGATIDDKMAGTLGLAASFSFYPTKVLNTAEGGMITTDSEEIYKKSIILREHGKADHSFNVHTEFGYNWRFSEFHALLGIQQMLKADNILRERRKIASLYDKLLKDVPGITLFDIPDNIKSSYYKYICYLDDKIDRDTLKKRLKKDYNVNLTGEVYSDPCHSQPVFSKYPDVVVHSKDESFSVTDYVCKNHICLPLYPGLKNNEVEHVVNSLIRCIDS